MMDYVTLSLPDTTDHVQELPHPLLQPAFLSLLLVWSFLNWSPLHLYCRIRIQTHSRPPRRQPGRSVSDLSQTILLTYHKKHSLRLALEQFPINRHRQYLILTPDTAFSSKQNLVGRAGNGTWQ